MTSFLDALGLPPVGPKGGGKPIDLNLPRDDRVDPKKPIDFKTSDPKKQVELLADLIARTSDAVKRDQLVKALRNALAKIQPVMSDPEAKKQIDKLIDKGIDAAAKALLMKLIETVVGRKGTTMPGPDSPPQYGPNVKEEDLGERILKSPEIPFGKPPAVRRNSFEFRGLKKTVKPSAYVDFKLLTPDWFDPNKTPGSWVIVMEADDFKKNRQSAHNIHDVHIVAKGTLDLSLAMPDEPGHYVIAIKIQSDFENSPVEEIEVGK